MRTFKDLNGREWQLLVTVDTIRLVKDAFDGLNLLDLADESKGGFNRIFDDLMFFVDLLEFLTREQATEAKITPEQFARAVAGDVILDAQNAFLEAYIDLFPNPIRREAMLRALEKARELELLVIRRNAKELEAMSLEDLEQLAGISTPTAGNSPEKSASTTPAPAPSENSA